MFKLFSETFGVEELFESASDLIVSRIVLSVFSTFDDDKIHVAREEVASLADSDSGFELVTGSDPDLFAIRVN